VAAIRGVNCDAVFRTLLTRGLVEEAGTVPDSGAHLYRTSSVFLEKLGLDSVAELPPLAPLLPDDLSALDPDLRPLAARNGAARDPAPEPGEPGDRTGSAGDVPG
jgi:hypothetical protein